MNGKGIKENKAINYHFKFAMATRKIHTILNLLRKTFLHFFDPKSFKP